MPIYRSAGVAVSLLAAPLDLKPTAFGSRNKPVDTEATLPQEKCDIYERPLLDTDNLGPLRFIGPVHDIPFFLAQAIDRHPEVDPDRGPTTRTFLKSAFQPARCLSLNVDVSKCHFTRTKDQHAKIEVFYNGTLAACRALKLVRSSASKSQADSKQEFSGRRVGLQFEKPFVIAPLLWTDTLQHQDTPTDAEIWASVGSSLLEEAGARGRNKYGDMSPVSECLVALAGLPLPSFRPDSKRHIGRHMGTIDVIVSLGTSKKEVSSYAINGKPTRLRDPAFQIPAQKLPKNKPLGRKGYNVPRLPTMRQSLPNLANPGSRVSKVPPKATKNRKSRIVRLKIAATRKAKEVTGSTETRGRPTQSPRRPTTPASSLFADPGILVHGSTIAPFTDSGAGNPWINRARGVPSPTAVYGGLPTQLQQMVQTRASTAAMQHQTPVQGAWPSMPMFGPLSPAMQHLQHQTPFQGWRPLVQGVPPLAQYTMGLPSPYLYPPPSQFHSHSLHNPAFDPHSVTPYRAVVAPATPSRPEKNDTANTGAQSASNVFFDLQASPFPGRPGLLFGPNAGIPGSEPTRSRNTIDDKAGADIGWWGSTLDRGSVFTYAEPWMCSVDHSEAGLQAHMKPNSIAAAESMEVVRPTPRERPGEFREQSVLVAVRYVMI